MIVDKGEIAAKLMNDTDPDMVEVIRCCDCKHYIPEEFWQEDRGGGYFEIMCEPPSCKKWCVNIYDKDGEHQRYLFDVRPDGFCAWAEQRDA